MRHGTTWAYIISADLICADLCSLLDESSRCLTCASNSLIFSRASSLSLLAPSSSFSFSPNLALESSSSASSFLIFSAAGEGAPLASGRVTPPARAEVLAEPPTERAERELPGRAAVAPVPAMVEGRVGLVGPRGRVTVPVAGGAPARAEEADDRAAVAPAGAPTGRVRPPADGPEEEAVGRIGLAVETIPPAGRPGGRERPVVAVGAAEAEDVEDASEDRRGRVGPAVTEGRRVLVAADVVALPEVETGRPPAGTGRAVVDDEEARGRRAAVGPAAPEADIEDRRGALVVPAVAVPAERVGPVAFEARMAPPPPAAPRPMMGRAVELDAADGRVAGFSPPTVGGLRAAPVDAVGSLATGVGEVGSFSPPAAGTVGDPGTSLSGSAAAAVAMASWST